MDLGGGDFCVAPNWFSLLGLHGHAHDVFRGMSHTFVESKNTSENSPRYGPQSSATKVG